MAIVSPTLPVDAVRGLGNALRHDYDRVDLRMIYVTVTASLPRLRADRVATSVVIGEIDSRWQGPDVRVLDDGSPFKR